MKAFDRVGWQRGLLGLAGPSGPIVAVSVTALAGVSIAGSVLDEGWIGDARAVVGVFGLFAVWRYAWWFTHVVRSQIYQRRIYPRLKAQAANAWASGWRPSRLHILLTVYHEKPDTLERTLGAIVAEVRSLDIGVDLWIGTKEVADELLVEQSLEALAGDLDLHLHVVRQAGAGKRNAIALVLSAMARRGVGAGDVVAFMDSDFVLSAGALQSTVAMFAAADDLAAVTTDEDCIVHGPGWVQSWLDMRFAQRRLAMQSHALSGRVLTLTGRFSVFRGEHVVAARFIELVAADTLDHWLWGRFRFLSGDDKSTWFALLETGCRMLYVPDAHGVTIEVIEGAAIVRMIENLRRWSGNMLRNGARAIALGPGRMPAFIWWCLVDQRIAMWTMLLGPVCAIVGALIHGPVFLAGYGIYVLATRLVSALVLACYARRLDPNFIWTLYANQLLNSAIKLYMIWRLPKQRWFNRGDQRSAVEGSGMATVLRHGMAGYLTVLSAALLLIVALYVTDATVLPGAANGRVALEDLFSNAAKVLETPELP